MVGPTFDFLLKQEAQPASHSIENVPLNNQKNAALTAVDTVFQLE
jgi:hypothetical protein